MGRNRKGRKRPARVSSNLTWRDDCNGTSLTAEVFALPAGWPNAGHFSSNSPGVVFNVFASLAR